MRSGSAWKAARSPGDSGPDADQRPDRRPDSHLVGREFEGVLHGRLRDIGMARRAAGGPSTAALELNQKNLLQNIATIFEDGPETTNV